MPYAKTSLRKEKRDLREKMRGLGLGYRGHCRGSCAVAGGASGRGQGRRTRGRGERSRAHPLGISRREVLASMGGGLAAGAVFPGSPAMPSGALEWADALCHAVVDPARAARDAAVSPQPGQQHDGMGDVLGGPPPPRLRP